MMAMVIISQISTTLYLKFTRILTSSYPSMDSGLITPGYVLSYNSSGTFDVVAILAFESKKECFEFHNVTFLHFET
jgi:hypothetical protein